MNAIKMVGIVKHFGSVKANDGIDFEVEKQEIHCLLGENGTGKSTLMNILFGLHRPDKGEIHINGKQVQIGNPNDAYVLGIGMVHQHFMLVNQLTVLENIILGNESGSFFLNRIESKKKVLELVERFGFKIDLKEKVVNLSVGMKQRVEILKTLYRGAEIVILDEPTAVLTPQEVDELFKILLQLKANGKTIVFITHKLNETMALSDKITVIRKGKVVLTCDTKNTNEKALATAMVGRQIESIIREETSVKKEVLLQLYDVRLHDRAKNPINLTVRAGEIVGIAGVDGNGQQELEELIIGTRVCNEGTISFSDTPIQHMGVKERKELGIGYIPSDRHKHAMISGFSITENFLLGYQESKKYIQKGLINYKQLEKDAKEQVEAFEIKVSGVDQEIGQLSGGNQQKVILGREVSHSPKLVIAAQPVRGLDIGAIEKVHKTLLQLKNEGKAILLISAELSEVMNLSDHIAVMYEGEICAAFPNGQYSKEEIGLFMAGKRQEEMNG